MLRGAVAIRRFQGVSDIPLRREGQTVGGHGRPGDGHSRLPASRDTSTSLYVVPAKALEVAVLVGLGGDAGVQRKASGLGQVENMGIW